MNFEGAGLGWAGHWRENCYEPCPCREKGLCAWAVEGAWEAGGPGRPGAWEVRAWKQEAERTVICFVQM